MGYYFLIINIPPLKAYLVFKKKTHSLAELHAVAHFVQRIPVQDFMSPTNPTCDFPHGKLHTWSQVRITCMDAAMACSHVFSRLNDIIQH